MNDIFTQLGDWSETGKQASGVILEDAHGRLLMQLRDINERTVGAGQWSFFGGHIEGEEDTRTAALREFKEETGIALTLEEITPFAKTLSSRGTRLYAYTAHKNIMPSDICLGEGAGFAFLTPEQVKAVPLLPAAGLILHHYLERTRTIS